MKEIYSYASVIFAGVAVFVATLGQCIYYFNRTVSGYKISEMTLSVSVFLFGIGVIYFIAYLYYLIKEKIKK